MKIINALFLSTFSGLVFFSILLVPIISEVNLVTSLLLVFVFLPLFLASFWKGLIAYVPVVVVLIGIAFVDINLSLSITILFLIPTFLISLVVYKYKDISNSYVLSIISIYTSLVCVGVLVYYGFLGNAKSIHNVLNDTITFIFIYANQFMGEEFQQLTNLPEQIDILSFTLPSIISIAYIMWLFLNYNIASKIAVKSDLLTLSEEDEIFNLPNIYTFIFIVLIVISLLAHKILDKNQNLYYICYNVLFILCFGYFYSGFCFLWNKVKSKNSLLISVLFSIFIIVLFVECMILFSIIGFIIELKRIVLKNKM